MKSYFKNIQRQIKENLATASQRVDIAVAWFTNTELFDQILQVLERKVEVNLIIVNDSINNNPEGLDFDAFIKKGGNLFFAEAESLMHHKFVVIDDRVLINGSYNWTYFAEYKNHENIIVIDDAVIIQNFSIEFNGLLKFFSKQKSYTRNSTFLNLENDRSLRKLVLNDLESRSYKEEKNGNYSRAISISETALLIEPEKKEIKEAILTLRRKNTSETIKSFDTSSFLSGTNSALNDLKDIIRKASKAYRNKEYDKSLQTLLAGKNAYSNFAELDFWIALCYWKKGLLNKALEHCKKSITSNKTYALAFNLGGIIFYEQKNLDLAIRLFGQALDRNPNLYKSFFNRGQVFSEKGKVLEAQSDLKKCLHIVDTHLREYPNDVEAIAIQGDCYLLLGKRGKAMDSYKRAKEIVAKTKIWDVDLNVVDRIDSGILGVHKGGV